MKRILAGLIVAAAMVAPAMAADLAPRAYTKAAPVDLGYNWSGWYVGGNAGYAWGRSDPSTTTEFTPTNYWNSLSVPQVNAAGTGPRLNTSGFVGGGQFGYNYQTGSIVWGAEADFESFNIKGSRSGAAVYACCAGSFNLNQTTSTDWLFTLRGRLVFTTSIETTATDVCQSAHSLDTQAALHGHHATDVVVDVFSPATLLCWRRASTLCKALLKKSASNAFSARRRFR